MTEEQSQVEYVAGDAAVKLDLAQIEQMFILDAEHAQYCEPISFKYTTNTVVSLADGDNQAT